jgi:inner membrane transporter RhtA
VSLVVAAAVSQEFGAAFAVTLFDHVGPVGAAATRFLFAAALLVPLVRPRIRGLSRDAWATAAALGAALALMNAAFYQAIARIPLGVAVTIEICGPLVLSVVLARHRSAWLWAIGAAAGVALLGSGHAGGQVGLTGVVFAGVAGVGWALYVVASARAAARFPRLDALAIASCVGAALLVPPALLTGSLGALTVPGLLGTAIAVAALSSVVPYSLELTALRTLPATAFAVLTSLSPIVAAIAGAVVLHQDLRGQDWLAIVLVAAASAGAVRAAARVTA